jgi:hypothetical protein
MMTKLTDYVLTAEDAPAYNELIISWTGIESAAAKEPPATQRIMFE